MGNPSTPQSKLVEATRVSGGSDSPSPLTHGNDLEPGAQVGDYRIERKIGHGGMGSVYEAIHPIIEKRVAIKVLRPELSKNAEAVGRFVQEARAVNRIRHPSIVDVFGYGTTEDGRCYLVMELLDGESLGRRLEYDPPSVAEACDILIAITYALDAAHSTGIVHRDLKPDNVFLVEGKHVKLLDFGIAKLTLNEQPQLTAEYTQPGQAMGTPRYIAPEQARGDAVDARTDIYSLGVMAFELLCGRLPFVGDNAMELIALHITMPPPTPTDIANLPPTADTLLLQMLDKNPINRPSLGAVRTQLDEIRAPWVTSITGRISKPKPTPQTIAAPSDPPPASKPRWILPLAITLALGIACGAFFVVRGMTAATDDQPTTRAAEPEPTQKIAPKPEPKIEAKPEPQIEVKPEPKIEVKPEPQIEAKPKRPVRNVESRKPTKPTTVKTDELPGPPTQPPPPPEPKKVPDDPNALKKPSWKK